VSQYWGVRETNEAFERMMYECNRANNAEEKLRSFLNMQQHLIDLIDHLQYLDQLASRVEVSEHYPCEGAIRRLMRKPGRLLKRLGLLPLVAAQFIAKGNSTWWWLSMGLVLWISLFVLQDYSEDFMYREYALKFQGSQKMGFFGRPSNAHFDGIDPHRLWKVHYPSQLQNVFACFMLVSHLIVAGWVGVTQKMRENPEQLLSVGDFLGGALTLRLRVPYYPLALFYAFSDSYTLYYAAYFAVSVVASSYFYPLYVVCLTDLAVHNLTMQYILRSVTRNFQRLFFALVFAFILVWVLATYAFFTPSLHGHYVLGDHMSHTNLLGFVRVHWDYGLREAPSFIDDEFADPNGQWPWVGFMFNVVYNFFILLVMTAIVSGIIIDTFSEMRAEGDAVREAMENLCFVCSIPRDRFETAGESLEEHRSNEHNGEHYIFLRVFLSEKDPNNFTGQEQYVQHCIANKNIRFFPLKKAGRLVLTDDDELDELASRLDGLEETVEGVRQQNETQTKLLEDLVDEVKKLKSGDVDAPTALPSKRPSMDQMESSPSIEASTSTKIAEQRAADLHQAQMKSLVAAHEKQMKDMEAKIAALFESVEDRLAPALRARELEASDVRLASATPRSRFNPLR